MLHSGGADNPLGDHQRVGGFDCRNGEELDFILLEDFAFDSEITHLVVAILYGASGLSDEGHALNAEIVELRERRRLVIAFLVGCREEALIF